MISFVSGKLDMIFDDFVIVDNNGIGYQIIMSSSTICKLPQKGEEIKLYTYMDVKDDSISLYGFISMEEIQAFNMLISVSGIGPKGALGMLAILSPQDLMLSIVADDISALSKAPGVGKKTAQRLILELKDKIKTNYIAPNAVAININKDGSISSNKQDAIDALLVLGYSQAEAVKVVVEVAQKDTSVEEIIKLALKKLK